MNSRVARLWPLTAAISFVRHFDAVDTGLYGSATADAHAIGELVHLQTGDAEVIQQIVGTGTSVLAGSRWVGII